MSLRPFPPAAEDSSDDDEPLIKMAKKAPSEEQLKDTVKSLLKEANVEEMTMKQICQRVRAATRRPSEDLLLLSHHHVVREAGLMCHVPLVSFHFLMFSGV